MLSYLVIGVCIILLFAVVFVSIKPISMGIEARRDNKSDQPILDSTEDEFENDSRKYIVDTKNISDEILKLNELKKEGILTDEEYEKAKKKLLD